MATTDPVQREAVLDQIVRVCIDLGRDCASFQEQLQNVRAQIAKQDALDKTTKQRQQANEDRKRRATEALNATPPRLAEAAAELEAAIKLSPKDPETAGLVRQLAERQTRQLYRTISIIVLITLAAIAAGVPLWKALTSRVTVRELEMLEGPDPGEVFRLEKEKTSLGAIAPEADIVIADPFRKISRRHCEIVRSGGHYFLTDTSTNGTSINGKPAPKGQPVLLKKGDRIELAEDVVLRFK